MLVLSTFLNALYDGRKDFALQQYDFAYDFFAMIVPNGGDPLKERPYLSNLSTGVRDLTKDVKTFIISPAGKKLQQPTFQNWVWPLLNPETIEDTLAKIHSIINNDETISVKQRDKLLTTYNNEKYIDFLVNAFRYAVSQDNVQVKSTVDAADVEFVTEVQMRCPLCNKSLKCQKKKKNAFHYSVISIFPEGLPEETLYNFESIKKKPIDRLHSMNRICLCPACADAYLYSPTTEIYGKLVSKKNAIHQADLTRSKIDHLELDEQIGTVLLSLKKINPTVDLVEFRTIPLTIKEKIQDNELLREKILEDVNKYYYFVRRQLSALDEDDTEFRIIASEIQTCYLKLKQEKLSQEEIYYQIIDWILEKIELTAAYKAACQIVVSFFVQNCEVFDEITQ